MPHLTLLHADKHRNMSFPFFIGEEEIWIWNWRKEYFSRMELCDIIYQLNLEKSLQLIFTSVSKWV